MFIKKKLSKMPLIIVVIIGIIITISSVCSYAEKTSVIVPHKDELLVHYIDVGQGDAILLQFNDKNILIDSGPGNNKAVKYLKKQGIKRLNYVIATHPHDDHIGSMDSVINNFHVDKFLAPNVTNNTDAFKNMLTALKNKDLKISPIISDLKFNVNNELVLFIISPKDSYDNLNNYSPIIKVSYKNTSFLFLGDAETERENEIISSGYNISADVLKVGHHGSTSSTSKKFLDEVNPKIAIISCGIGNDYGHPHKQTLLNLKEKGIITFRTDIDKDIVLESDGNKIVKRK